MAGRETCLPVTHPSQGEWHGLDLYPYEEHQSEAADGEEPETGREMRQDINEILELERKNMIVDGGFSEIVDYLLFQDKVSFFANEMNGFLCVEPEPGSRLSNRGRPANPQFFSILNPSHKTSFCWCQGQQHRRPSGGGGNRAGGGG